MAEDRMNETNAPELNGTGRAPGRGLLTLLRRFSRDRSGIGAIEFAILAPVLLLLYLGALETTIALSVAKRASRAAGAVADIITQQTSVSKSVLATMPSAVGAIFAPYSNTGLTLKITGITIDASSKATVTWSWAQDGSTPYAKNSTPTGIPTDMNKASSFLVRTELSIPYQLLRFGPDFLPAGTNTITIARQYFYRQRTGTSIPCGDC
jgi:Flp pilus assembly protein TadG